MELGKDQQALAQQAGRPNAHKINRCLMLVYALPFFRPRHRFGRARNSQLATTCLPPLPPAGKHRVPFQQKLVHGDQSTSGPRPAGHVPISKSTGLVVAVLRVGLQQEGARPRIRGWTTDLDS